MANQIMVSVLYICLTLSLVLFVPTHVFAQNQGSASHVLHVNVNAIEYEEDIDNLQYYKVRATVFDIERQPTSSIQKGDTISFQTYITSGNNNGNNTADPIAIFEDDCIRVFLKEENGMFVVGAGGQSIELLPETICGKTQAPVSKAPVVPVPQPVRNPPVPRPVPFPPPVSFRNPIPVPQPFFVPVPFISPNIFLVPTLPPAPAPIPVVAPRTQAPVPTSTGVQVVTIPTAHTTIITFMLSTIIGCLSVSILFL